jgi:hypothetical protein
MRAPYLFISALVLAAGDLAAQDSRTQFTWNGTLASGKTLEIIGVNGRIAAEGTPGRQVEVHASKQGDRSDPATVTFEVLEHAGGVTICAMYPSDGRRENECLVGGKGRMNTRNNDVDVSWTIKVPSGVHFEGRTVNGRVEARGMTAPVLATTVNGSILVETTSWADASTINGSMTVRMGRADWTGEKTFSTVNGGITVYLPASASLEVDASNVTGSLSTDFPLTIRGRWGPRSMSGVIGSGGRQLSLSTVTGSLELRKGS